MIILERLLRLFGFLIALFAIIGIQIFIGVAILSALVVPFTYLYARLVGQSYNSLIDSSGMLYKLNKLGQWTIICLAGIAIFYLMLFIYF